MVKKTDLPANGKLKEIISRFAALWSSASESQEDIHEDAARREHITRSALALMTVLLLPFTLLILVMWSLKMIDSLGVWVILWVDIFVFNGWWLLLAGKPHLAALIPPALLFSLGTYGSFSIGLVTTFTLAYAIAIILVSSMFSERYTWLALLVSLSLHLTLGSYRSGVPMANLLETALPFTALLTGLALLQHFTAGLLQQALSKTRRDGEELKNLNRELSLINRVISVASASLEETGILQAACRELAVGLEMPLAYAAVIDSSQAQLKFLAEYPPPVRFRMAGQDISRQSIPDAGAILQETGPVVLLGHPHHERLENFELWLQNNSFASALALPLLIRGQSLGFIILLSAQARSFTPQEITLASNAAASAAQAVDNARLYAELKSQAQRDELTGLLNRRGLMELGGREFERARRFGRALSVIFVDADNLKKINDRYGHAVGDLALKFMASQLRRNTREFDLAGRLGGDEFIILLAEADQALAHEIAERLRKQVNDAPLSVGVEQAPVSISVGVAQLEQHSSLEELIGQADEAMYQSKQSGRNRISR